MASGCSLLVAFLLGVVLTIGYALLVASHHSRSSRNVQGFQPGAPYDEAPDREVDD